MKKESLKLEDRNVKNTKPEVLKRLHNEDFERKIENLRKKKEFSIVSFIFFALVSIMFYVKPVIFGSDAAIYPSLIMITFSLAIIVCEFLIKDGLVCQRISNSLIDSFIENNKEK